MSKDFFNRRIVFPMSNLILFLTVFSASYILDRSENPILRQSVKILSFVVLYVIGYIRGVGTVLM